MMNKLDLRQVGTIMGLPIYIDFNTVPNVKVKEDIPLTERDLREMEIIATLRNGWKM